MAKHTAQAMAMIMVILAGITIINGLVIPDTTAIAQNDGRDMQALLQTLVDDDVTFSIWFVTPVWEARPFWEIPGEIVFEGNIIGRRLVREISDDYLCVDEIGQGVTDTICVPFTNIAYVNFIEGDRPSDTPPE